METVCLRKCCDLIIGWPLSRQQKSTTRQLWPSHDKIGKAKEGHSHLSPEHDLPRLVSRSQQTQTCFGRVSYRTLLCRLERRGIPD